MAAFGHQLLVQKRIKSKKDKTKKKCTFSPAMSTSYLFSCTWGISKVTNIITLQKNTDFYINFNPKFYPQKESEEKNDREPTDPDQEQKTASRTA